MPRFFSALVAAATLLLLSSTGSRAEELRLAADPAGWRLALGTEFPGAKATLELDGDALRIDADFTGGGRYVGITTGSALPPFAELAFQAKAPGNRLAVRVADAEGQTHQYDLALEGDADGWRDVTCPLGASTTHWGGANDGVFRGPARSLSILLLAAHTPGQRGALLLRDLRLRGIEAGTLALAVRPAELTQSFIAPGSTEPLRLRLVAPLGPFAAEQLDYAYSDYAGQAVAAGRAAHDPANERLLVVPPPTKPGYYDLTFPALGIHTSVVVDHPVADLPADEYFGIDIAFSRGGIGLDVPYYEQLFRVLRKNNIRWIRERLTPRELQPERDRFDFEARAGRYRLLREIADREGLHILDVFHDAPAWNKRLVSDKDDFIAGGDVHGIYTKGSNLYPRDLVAAAAGIDTLTRRFLPDKAALEVWNEPNIDFGNHFPGEFPTALTKAIAARFARTGNPAVLVGGVFSEAPLLYYDSYVANGLLRCVDAVSYHSYHAVEKLEEEATLIRAIEERLDPEHAGLPYWITESGLSWPRGGDRARFDDARRSALEITAKAIEFRALGAERYFAFIYRFYNEHRSNHGMMDAQDAPQRSMAAYAHVVRALSHKDYLGDVKVPGTARGRVFGDGREVIACLYAPIRPTAPPEFLTLPDGLRVLRAEGIDGRTLEIANGRVPFGVDGLVYLYLDGAPEGLLDRDTRAMKLYRQVRDRRPVPREAKPIVVQPDYDMLAIDYTTGGVQIRAGQNFAVRAWFNNFADQPRRVEPALDLPGGIVADGFDGTAFELGVDERKLLEFTLRVTDDRGVFAALPVKLDDARGGAIPLVISVRQQPLPDRFAGRRVDFTAMEQPGGWRENSAGTIAIRRDEADDALVFATHFPPKVDRWTYPEFMLPEPGLLKNAVAIGFETKVDNPEHIRQMLVMAVFSDEKERGPAAHLRVPHPTAGWEYRCVFFPPGVDPATIKMLRFGVNALDDDVEVGLRKVTVFYVDP